MGAVFPYYASLNGLQTIPYFLKQSIGTHWSAPFKTAPILPWTLSCILSKENYMTEVVSSNKQNAAQAPLVLEHQRIMAPLLARPPLATRAGALAAMRTQNENAICVEKKGMDETAAVKWWLGMGAYWGRAVLKMLGLYRRGIRNARDYRIVHHDLQIPGLPEAFAGFQILHVSDFHLPRRHPELAEFMGRALMGVKVDLCALTGDYRYGYFGATDHVPGQLHTILSGVTSRYGVVCVLGNHDRFIVGEKLEAAGFPVLFNEGIAIRKGTEQIWVSGMDEHHKFKCGRMEEALQGAPEQGCILMLTHTPENIAEAAARGVSLYLAGHTHGGQIRLPLLGALLSNAQCQRDQVWGSWRFGNMVGYTTSGIGATDIPARFNCPPEAAILTLYPAPADPPHSQ